MGAKMAIMKSEELFHLLEKHGHSLVEHRFAPQAASDNVPARVLRLSIETMLEELAPNLWEHSLDRLVDFGHVVGQNLEMSALGSEDKLMHGEAVACDMAYMSVLSNVLGLITVEERDEPRIFHLQVCEVTLAMLMLRMRFCATQLFFSQRPQPRKAAILQSSQNPRKVVACRPVPCRWS